MNKRPINMTPVEKGLLANISLEYQTVIDSKVTAGITVKMKGGVWHVRVSIGGHPSKYLSQSHVLKGRLCVWAYC